jgi:hypothetical protein
LVDPESSKAEEEIDDEGNETDTGIKREVELGITALSLMDGSTPAKSMQPSIGVDAGGLLTLFPAGNQKRRLRSQMLELQVSW